VRALARSIAKARWRIETTSKLPARLAGSFVFTDKVLVALFAQFVFVHATMMEFIFS
jgi:hypothetical protein